MKTIASILLSSLALYATPTLAHPDHDQDSPLGRKGIISMPPPSAEKSYGRPGANSEITRSIGIDINDKMRVTPTEISVKPGETIKFVVKNSAKTPQRMALGTASELKERIATLKQFPKMEMNQPNLVQVLPGESAELVWQFTQVGTFNYGCTAPACLDAGAIGKIVVNAK